MDARLRINGPKIVTLRKGLGLTQEQLCKLSGITSATLRDWEHSIPYTPEADRLYRPTIRLIDVANVLGCTARELFYCTGPLNITSYRYFRQIDVLEASKHLPFSNATLTRIETGKRIPTSAELIAMSALYSTPPVLIAAAAEETLRTAANFPALSPRYTPPPTIPDHDVDLFDLLAYLTAIPWETQPDITAVHDELGTPLEYITALTNGASFHDLPTHITQAYAAYLHIPIATLLDCCEAQRAIRRFATISTTLKTTPLLLQSPLMIKK